MNEAKDALKSEIGQVRKALGQQAGDQPQPALSGTQEYTDQAQSDCSVCFQACHVLRVPCHREDGMSTA